MEKFLTQQDVLNRLGYYMSKQKLSAYEISLRLGHSTTYFYRVQKGEIKLTVEMLLKILEILGVEAEEFFACDLEKYALDKEKLRAVNGLDKSQLYALNELLKNKR